MRKFLVLIRGSNLVSDFDGEKLKVGFYAYRVIPAESESAASTQALEVIKQTSQWRSALNRPEDPPTASIHSVKRLPLLSFKKDSGFMFYDETDGDASSEAFSMVQE